jgi:two-component system OmpR family sensor kinase
MRAHAGEVSVESEVGKGAVFTLFFPLSTDA